MLRRRLILGFALLPFLPWLTGCKKAPLLTPLPSGSMIVALGDSVTYGTGAAPGEDWPTLLAQKTGWLVVNGGVPGDTVPQGAARLAELLEAHHPQLVILELGGNDFLQRRPQASVKEDLRQIIRSIRSLGIQVVLVAVPELSLLSVVAGKAADAPIYEELADEESIPLIPDIFSEILSQPELCADKVHPNAAGYRVFAEGMESKLKDIGLL